MKRLLPKQQQIYRLFNQALVAQEGWLRRVDLGPKNHNTGDISSVNKLIEARVIEQKQQKSHRLNEVTTGQRRFQLAVSGRIFLADAEWHQITELDQPIRPLIGDRLWLARESKELLMTQEPAILDAGFGVLFEIVVQ